jgi:PhoH-like ATPase
VEQDLRTYVLDTSVLLSDPRAFFRFAEHSVVVPVVVITELEGKRHDPELGYFARQALRHLDELRVEHGRLDFPVPVGEGGTLRVELANTDASVLPQGLRLSDNDTRILSVAMHLAQDGQEVTVVSKDLPMRVKAASLGINAEEYLAEQAVDSGWTGIADLHLSGDDISDLYEAEVASSDEVRGLPVNTGLMIHSERGSALGRVTGDGGSSAATETCSAARPLGRAAHRDRPAARPEVGIVSLGGRAGTGKSALALCAGLEAVLERQQQKKIIVFRPLFAVGGQELGYLPGDQAEKMNPWGQAVFDTLGSVVSGTSSKRSSREDARGAAAHAHPRPLAARRVRDRRRGAVARAQRAADGAQPHGAELARRAHPRRRPARQPPRRPPRRHRLRHRDAQGPRLFGHVTLTRSERSAIAALVTDLLEQGELS